MVTRRSRAGADVEWIVSQFTFKGEASFGRDFDRNVFTSLAEANWNSPGDKVQLYLQGVYLGSEGAGGWGSDVELRVGSLWQVTNHVAVSGEYSQDLVRPAGERRDARFTLQLRFYF
jgi:hypothetical protein